MAELEALINGWLDIPAVRAGLAILLSVLAGFMFRTLVCRILLKLVSGTETKLDDHFVHTFQGPIVSTIIVCGLRYAIHTLELPDTPKFILIASVHTWLILSWMVACWRFSNHLLDWMVSRGELGVVQHTTRPLFSMIFKTLVIVVSSYYFILAWDQDVRGWLTSAGVLGIAVGFAAKDTLANFISGVFIIADRPYKIGDFIVLDGQERGQVTDIGIRSTRIMTRDDIEVIIPNAIIGNAKIVNESGGPHVKFRVPISIGVAYGSNIDLVRDILQDVAAAESLVLANPAPRVVFTGFGDSSLDFLLMVWAERPGMREEVIDAVNVRIYKALAENKVEIPYPKRDVYLHNAD